MKKTLDIHNPKNPINIISRQLCQAKGIMSLIVTNDSNTDALWAVSQCLDIASNALCQIDMTNLKISISEGKVNTDLLVE